MLKKNSPKNHQMVPPSLNLNVPPISKPTCSNLKKPLKNGLPKPRKIQINGPPKKKNFIKFIKKIHQKCKTQIQKMQLEMCKKYFFFKTPSFSIFSKKFKT
jgi:hypothetical protein